MFKNVVFYISIVNNKSSMNSNDLFYRKLTLKSIFTIVWENMNIPMGKNPNILLMV